MPPKKKSSGFPSWATILIVVIVLAVVAFSGFVGFRMMAAASASTNTDPDTDPGANGDESRPAGKGPSQSGTGGLLGDALDFLLPGSDGVGFAANVGFNKNTDNKAKS